MRARPGAEAALEQARWCAHRRDRRPAANGGQEPNTIPHVPDSLPTWSVVAGQCRSGHGELLLEYRFGLGIDM